MGVITRVPLPVICVNRPVATTARRYLLALDAVMHCTARGSVRNRKHRITFLIPHLGSVRGSDALASSLRHWSEHKLVCTGRKRRDPSSRETP